MLLNSFLLHLLLHHPRNALCTEGISSFLDDHFIFYVASLGEFEGYNLAVSLGLLFTPFIAVVFYDRMGDMHIVDTIKGNVLSTICSLRSIPVPPLFVSNHQYDTNF